MAAGARAPPAPRPPLALPPRPPRVLILVWEVTCIPLPAPSASPIAQRWEASPQTDPLAPMSSTGTDIKNKTREKLEPKTLKKASLWKN